MDRIPEITLAVPALTESVWDSSRIIGPFNIFIAVLVTISSIAAL
jgi:hypothetical protein